MAQNTKDILLSKLRSGETMARSEQFRLAMLLAVPSILSQLSMCMMSYIDAAMVGRLGSAQAAAVGLVSTSTWLLSSFCFANSTGFSVQIAHSCGAKDYKRAATLFRQGLLTVMGISLLITIIGIVISSSLPIWLGADESIASEAGAYFLIYSAFLPTLQFSIYCEAALIASGNSKVPGIVCFCMCALDVLFNYLLIFVLELGVVGAAVGTGLATTCAGIFLYTYVLKKSPELRESISITELRKSIKVALQQGFSISWPLWLQNIVSRGAYIAATVLIAPLGTIAIAANSFAIIAEGFCYLPGYGVHDSATSLVGQSLGAGRKDSAQQFAGITISSGAAMMAILSVFMWIFAPEIIGLMSKDAAVIELGAKCLRIEAWAELLYGVSIVAYGCCVGAGDTLIPMLISLASMWIIRIGLALLLIPHYGLEGYWIAMAIELSIKGIIFALRIKSKKWMEVRAKLA